MGLGGLNYRVRDGNGCGPSGMEDAGPGSDGHRDLFCWDKSPKLKLRYRFSHLIR